MFFALVLFSFVFGLILVPYYFVGIHTKQLLLTKQLYDMQVSQNLVNTLSTQRICDRTAKQQIVQLLKTQKELTKEEQQKLYGQIYNNCILLSGRDYLLNIPKKDLNKEIQKNQKQQKILEPNNNNN